MQEVQGSNLGRGKNYFKCHPAYVHLVTVPMHQGFRQEEWVVERTPVNTPDDKVVVGMINLSDEETSNHVDSDMVFKSSTAATSPQEGSIFDSMADLPTDGVMPTAVVVSSESAPAMLGDTEPGI